MLTPRSRLPDPKRLEDCFPNVVRGSMTITSCTDEDYNCVAWAIADASRWWDHNQPWWPSGLDRDDLVDTYAAFFSRFGYIRCRSARLEKGFEKVALYSFGKEFRHVAWQKPDGVWVSKLGGSVDVEHASLE